MGESREGEGRSRKATTSDYAQYLLDHYDSDERTVESMQVSRVTDQILACRITFRGESEPEAFFISTRADGGL